MVRIVSIGEPLVELTQSADAPGLYRKGLGGDTLNTAVYLARLLGPGQVSYVTRLGDDALSDWILSELTDEGIETDNITRVQGKTPGLSMIECDENGDRSFTYWRSQSAARDLLQNSVSEEDAVRNAPALFVSAVTLAVLGPSAHATILGLMAHLKSHGHEVFFDLNYRPALWENAELARYSIARALAASTLALPSFDDVSELWQVKTHNQALSHLKDLGAAEILLKSGGGPVHYAGPTNTRRFQFDRVHRPVDTTGAGDSFNAAFIAGRLLDLPFDEAVSSGHALASRVVQSQGAIIDRSAMPLCALTT